MILGLDLSTTFVGVAIVDNDCKLVHCFHIDLEKQKTLHSKVKQILYVLEQDVFAKYFIQHVAIENIMTKFASGKSSSKVLFSLAFINHCVQWEMFKKMNVEPHMINVRSARSLLKIKVPKDLTALEKKSYIVNEVVKHVGVWQPELDYKFAYMKYNFDIADAIVIALAEHDYIFNVQVQERERRRKDALKRKKKKKSS